MNQNNLSDSFNLLCLQTNTVQIFYCYLCTDFTMLSAFFQSA